MRVTVKLSPEHILAARGLGTAGGARRYLAERVRQRCDKYVPFDTGALKNSAEISWDGGKITYGQPYAREQFYGSYRHRDPLRGDRWHRRMLAAEAGALRAEMAAYLKGGSR